MSECREAFFDGTADRREADDVGQTQIPHDGPAHEAPSIIVAVNVGHDKQRHAVGPWDQVELLPPPLEDHRHIEPQNKGHRDQAVVLITVFWYFLKNSETYPGI